MRHRETGYSLKSQPTKESPEWVKRRTEYHEHAVAAMIEQHFAPLLVGQDPSRISYLWQQMRRFFWWRGGIVESSAASGIEQALWDITGKLYGQPVYKLLGGAVRDAVRLYARTDLGLPTPWR